MLMKDLQSKRIEIISENDEYVIVKKNTEMDWQNMIILLDGKLPWKKRLFIRLFILNLFAI